MSELKKTIVTVEQEHTLNNFLGRLQAGEPVQYVLGETWFYGLKLFVNPSVLIPRPETEFLADLVIRENLKPGMHILDVCTGSGCLGIALKKNMKASMVSACDISEEALATAGRNAIENNCEIDFFSFDLLHPQMEKIKGTFHIITANPPYVTEKEKAGMHVNVKCHEPGMALFVPDEDPLLFYRAIASLAKLFLDKNGKLYVEINEAYGTEVADCFREKGFPEVRIRKDPYGKDRYVTAGSSMLI